MANKIQNDYRSHMQETSPDMDKLWDKIEQRIDVQQTDTKQTEQPQITASRGSFFKYAAVAACLIAVVASTVFFMNTKDNSVQKDTAKSSSNALLNKAPTNAEDKDRQENNDMAAADMNTTDNVTQKADNAAPTDQPTAEAVADEPKNKIKELMMTHDYLDADTDGRLGLVEQLAKQLQENGEISDFKLIKKENLSRVEITLPDGTIQGIILK